LKRNILRAKDTMAPNVRCPRCAADARAVCAAVAAQRWPRLFLFHNVIYECDAACTLRYFVFAPLE